MDAEIVIASAAALAAFGHIGWDVYQSWSSRRSDVRVECRHEPTPIAEGKYVVTLVATNHGEVDEHIERIGMWFDDPGELFEAVGGLQGQSVSAEVDAPLPPRANYRWSYDFGAARFRHGLGFLPWALLASGRLIEGKHGVADAKSLEIAGLGELLVPLDPEKPETPK